MRLGLSKKMYFVQSILFLLFRLSGCKTPEDYLFYQTDYLMDLGKNAGYNHDLDSSELFLDLFRVKFGTEEGQGVATFREHAYTSKYSGLKACPPKVAFMDEFEEDEDKIMAQYL